MPEGGRRAAAASVPRAATAARPDPLSAIRADRKAARLHQEASQLKSHAREATAFLVNAVASIGAVEPSLLSYFETLVSVVRLTDQFPDDAVFEVELGTGRLALGSDGRPLPESAAPCVLESPPDTAPLLLDGLDSTRPMPLSAFLDAHSRGRINRSTLEAFLGAPDRVKEDWDCARLRAFYATRGSDKWIPPIDDFVKIDRILDRAPGAARSRAVILRAMADAGAMGFCPTQYLRRVIAPRLGKDASRPEALARNAGLLADCFKYVREELGPAGDGSASNLFTLKTLIRPLAAPGSRLFDPRFLDDPGQPAAADVAFTIGKRWASLVADGGSCAREVMRGYAEGFIEGIVRIETPKGILARVLRLLDHLELLCSLVDSPARLAAFDKAAHVRGTAALLGRAEGSAHWATFLNTLLAHFDAVEAFARPREEGRGASKGPFGREYRRYLSCFSRGMFSSPEDVKAYVDSAGELAGRSARDSDELLETIMRHAKRPEERALLLGFARDCPVFDKGVYLRWRELDEARRAQALDFLKEAHFRYLVEPGYLPDGGSVGLDGVDVELALVKAHANASLLGKRQVEEILASHAAKALPPIPPQLCKPKRIEISERGFQSEGTGVKNLNPGFIKARLALARRVAEEGSEPEARPAELARLRGAAEARLRELRAGIAEASASPAPGAGQGERSAKRLAGLREQASGLEAFETCVEALAGALPAGSASGNASIGDAVEGALYFLAGDKAFAKAERETLAAFVLGRSLLGSPEALSEEPWASVVAAEPDAAGYGLEVLAPLRELWSTSLAGAVDAYFHGPFAALPPAQSAALRRLFASLDPRLAEGPAEALAERVSRLVSALAGVGQLDAELAAIEGERAKRKREILLVGAKRRLEHLFGYIGELCIARCTAEIYRKSFVPIRIVDLRELKVVGYVHVLLVGRGRPSGPREEQGAPPAALLMVGVEPKTSWMLHFDAAELYAGIKDYLVGAARETGAAVLLETLETVAHSNCPQMAALIAADLEGRPVTKSDNPIKFPEGYWNVLPAARLWPEPAKALPLDAGAGGNV